MATLRCSSLVRKTLLVCRSRPKTTKQVSPTGALKMVPFRMSPQLRAVLTQYHSSHTVGGGKQV